MRAIRYLEGPILGNSSHSLEQVFLGCWYNRSDNLMGYRNQFFTKLEIDIEPKNRHSYNMGVTTPHTTIEFSLVQFLLGLDKSPSTIQAYRTDIQQFLD
jgi:hypothetical protein